VDISPPLTLPSFTRFPAHAIIFFHRPDARAWGMGSQNKVQSPITEERIPWRSACNGSVRGMDAEIHAKRFHAEALRCCMTRYDCSSAGVTAPQCFEDPTRFFHRNCLLCPYAYLHNSILLTANADRAQEDRDASRSEVIFPCMVFHCAHNRSCMSLQCIVLVRNNHSVQLASPDVKDPHGITRDFSRLDVKKEREERCRKQAIEKRGRCTKKFEEDPFRIERDRLYVS